MQKQAENGEVKMEFASIYHQEELTKLLRTFKGDENGVTVTDEFIGAKQFTERLVTPFEPTIEDGKITVEGVTITFDGSLAKARYETEIHALELDVNGEIKRGQTMYLISIDVNEPKDKFTFRIDA